MEKTRNAVSLTEIDRAEKASELATAAAMRDELRSLSDFELWLVGGGDEIPHW